MTLKELKATVYQLAGVATTPQLKAKYGELKGLDMRRKASWEEALRLIQPKPDEFKTWLENPSEEYRELFAEIEAVTQDFDQNLEKAKQLGQALLGTADSLGELAETCQDDADTLTQEVEAGRRIARQAELN